MKLLERKRRFCFSVLCHFLVTYGGGKEIILSLMLFLHNECMSLLFTFFLFFKILLGFPLRNLRIAKPFLSLLLHLLELSAGFLSSVFN